MEKLTPFNSTFTKKVDDETSSKERELSAEKKERRTLFLAHDISFLVVFIIISIFVLPAVGVHTFLWIEPILLAVLLFLIGAFHLVMSRRPSAAEVKELEAFLGRNGVKRLWFFHYNTLKFDQNVNAINHEIEAAERGFNTMTEEDYQRIHAEYELIRAKLTAQGEAARRTYEYEEYLRLRQPVSDDLALNLLEADERQRINHESIVPVAPIQRNEELFEVVLREPNTIMRAEQSAETVEVTTARTR